jgi:predicted TIM-barrel fold metal-dependent hydrolase
LIIDAHIHLSESGKWLDSTTNISVDNVLYEMDKANIDQAVVLGLATFNNNKELFRLIEKHCDRFIPFFSIDKNNKKTIAEAEVMVKEYGFQGLKLHPRIQQIKPLDPVLFPLYEKMVELDKPIVFDTYPQCQNVLLEDLQPYVYDRLAKMYPELKIIMAHAGAHRLWDAYFVARSNPNVYIDISYICTTFEGTSLVSDLKFMLNTLDKKIIYGSDYPSTDIGKYLQCVLDLLVDLTLEKQKNILGLNIAKIINCHGDFDG